MLNASARRSGVSLPLASLAYQIFLQASSAGCDAADDCSVLQLYLFGRRELRKPESSVDRVAITELLTGIHAAAAVEVLRFAKHLGIDRAVLRDVVMDAAGSSRMFGKISTELPEEADISLKSVRNSGDIARNMVSKASSSFSRRFLWF